MIKYIIQDKEAGNIIEEVKTFKEAEKILQKYEEDDKKNKIYEKDFYEIVEIFIN